MEYQIYQTTSYLLGVLAYQILNFQMLRNSNAVVPSKSVFASSRNLAENNLSISIVIMDNAAPTIRSSILDTYLSI